jgi:type IV secretory pathway VirB2 component (pilin)
MTSKWAAVLGGSVAFNVAIIVLIVLGLTVWRDC